MPRPPRLLIPARIAPDAFARRDGAARVAMVEGRAMGTGWRVHAVAPPIPDAALADGIARLLGEVVADMSPWEAGSAISRFNRASAGSRHALPPDFATVMAAALSLAALSDGAFDPTAGAAVDLWGFGPPDMRAMPPDPDAVTAACATIGWRRLDWQAGTRTLTQPGGVRLDLSGIAKGFAVDKVTSWLHTIGVHAALVEIGGELAGHGVKPDGSPWWVDLERPPLAANIIPTRIALHGLAVATSGDYRRFFEAAGRRFAHTIDPRTAAPVLNDIASVSVVADRCMTADGWATALTVLGDDAGMALADRHGIAALFIVRRDGRLIERMTGAMRAMLD